MAEESTKKKVPFIYFQEENQFLMPPHQPARYTSM